MRGREDYEDYLARYAHRHAAIFTHRTCDEIADRVHDCLLNKRFAEPFESVYWTAARSRRRPLSRSEPSSSIQSSPAWSMTFKHTPKPQTPPPPPEEGGSEPFIDYRSLGEQIESTKSNSMGFTFRKTGDNGASRRTVAEEIAVLGPTPTSYYPRIDLTKQTPRTFTFKQSYGSDSINDKYAALVGPGAYESRSSIGHQVLSDKANTHGSKFSTAWAGRLDVSLEPHTSQQFSTKVDLPPEPVLADLT
jgi:hypothetical protein